MAFGSEAGTMMTRGRARTRIERLVTRRPLVTLLLVLGAGELVRIVLAFKSVGVPFDSRSYELVRDGLTGGDPWDVYGLNATASTTQAPRWPYPPGFFGVIVAVDGIADATGRVFIELLRAAISLGDLALAVAVWAVVRRRAPELVALIAAASVAFGPVFFLVSAAHGQLDGLAWLPAVLALLVWERSTSNSRAWQAGLLVGAGIAIKTVPGLMLLALLPSARDRREAATLIAAAAALPILLYLPFLGQADDIVQGLEYHGVPGLGGMSMVLQPSLAHQLLQYGRIDPTGVSRFLLEHGGVVSGLGVLAVFAVLVRRRTAAPEAIATLTVATLVLGFNYLPGYAVWALVGLLVAGRVAWAVGMQLALAIPTAMLYLGLQTGRPWGERAVYGFYVPVMALVLAGWAVMLIVLLRRRPAVG